MALKRENGFVVVAPIERPIAGFFARLFGWRPPAS
jgi:hypothetical protein